MSKRYVFWRRPDGRPENIDGKCAPDQLLAEFGKVSSINPDGNVFWSPSAFHIHKLELGIKLSSVILCPNGDELNTSDAWAILRNALIDAVKQKGGNQPIYAHEVLRLADRNAKVHFQLPIKKFALVSSLSLKQFPARRISIEGCSIETLPSRDRYPYPDTAVFRGSEIRSRLDASRKNQIVRVITPGRTVFEAAEKAFRALNLVRGLWSLFATHGNWTITIGGVRRRPMGVIHPSLVADGIEDEGLRVYAQGGLSLSQIGPSHS